MMMILMMMMMMMMIIMIVLINHFINRPGGGAWPPRLSRIIKFYTFVDSYTLFILFYTFLYFFILSYTFLYFACNCHTFIKKVRQLQAKYKTKYKKCVTVNKKYKIIDSGEPGHQDSPESMILYFLLTVTHFLYFLYFVYTFLYFSILCL